MLACETLLILGEEVKEHSGVKEKGNVFYGKFVFALVASYFHLSYFLLLSTVKA